MSYFPYFRVTFVTTLMSLSSLSSAIANSGAPKYDASTAKADVESMDCIVRHRYSSAVEKHIKGFVIFTRNNTQNLLGLSTVYFPKIEKVLKEEGLPDDLKYLTVLESMLDPHAESYVGAKGMWQLMPFIAEEYGLSMDDMIDERSDVERSARAGIRFLKDLYDQFGNWELALAAYNCGPSKVRRTLKSANKISYWGIRPYLPKQTQDFVPKFIAIKYIFTHYQEYNLTPTFPDLDMQLTEKVKIKRGHSLADIAFVTGLTEGMIASLNPSLKHNTKVYAYRDLEINLPSRVVRAYRDYIAYSDLYHIKEMRLNTPDQKYFKVVYLVDRQMSLDDFCEEYGLSCNQVRLWNDLNDSTIEPNQEIFIFDYHPLNPTMHVIDKNRIDASRMITVVDPNGQRAA